jgi:hypothetical protein
MLITHLDIVETWLLHRLKMRNLSRNSGKIVFDSILGIPSNILIFHELVIIEGLTISRTHVGRRYFDVADILLDDLLVIACGFNEECLRSAVRITIITYSKAKSFVSRPPGRLGSEIWCMSHQDITFPEFSG